MKKLLVIIFLSLYFIIPSQAEDIQDIEIEGMSIGESALNHFTEKEISEARDESYEDKEFITKTLFPKTSSSYEIYQISYKSLDKKKELHGINGVITFPKNILIQNFQRINAGKVQHLVTQETFQKHKVAKLVKNGR